MKFVLIAGHPNSVMNFRRNLIIELQDRSMEVHVLIPKLSNIDSDLVIERIEKIGVKVHEIRLKRAGTNLFLDLISFLDITLKLRRIKPDYVLSYTIKPVIYGLLAAKILGINNRFALITGLGSTFNEGKSLTKKLLLLIVNSLYKLSLLSANAVMFQNRDDKALFEKNKIVCSHKSYVVNGSGVDLCFYRFGKPPPKMSFLLLARLLNSKGVAVYFEAAKNIKNRYPKIEFRLAGKIDVMNKDSIERSELNSWIKSGVIKYYGELSDVRPAIKDCSVYVLPSFYREGVPRSILEAMSMGRAIITSNTPGCKETVTDGVNGYLAKPQSVSELEAAMMKFIDNPALAERMGIESRKMAEIKYDVHKVNKEMLKIMRIQ
jgi:glycosyltransferase involved in cell wall biosynthesis